MDLTAVFVWVAVSFALAFLVETLVEYILGTPMDHIERLKPYKWTLIYFGLVGGILLALYFKIDLIAVIAVLIARLAGNTTFVWQPTFVGYILSGAAIGHGSNYLHDFLVKVLQKPDVVPEIPTR